MIGAVEVLPRMFGLVMIPEPVASELLHHASPDPVKSLVQSRPLWLRVQSPRRVADALEGLGKGEREAISLAIEFHADLMLIDDREARAEAERRGIVCTGILGVLRRATDLGLLDFSSALALLQRTTLRLPKEFRSDQPS